MRPIRTLLAVASVLAAFGTASAATAGAAVPRWSAPATFAPSDGVGTCLRGAGADRLALLGELTATAAATDLLAVAPGRDPTLDVSATATLGWLLECAEVAVAAGERSATEQLLLAAPVHVPGRGAEVRVGAPGAAPVTLRRAPRGRVLTAVRVAVAADGAAMVAWVERRSSFHPELAEDRLMTAYRPGTDAGFGPARVLDDQLQHQPTAPPVLGIDAAGRATVAWHGQGESPKPSLLAAETDAAGSFGRPQPLVRTVEGGPGALAVAPDGRALLATGGWEEPMLLERPAGGRRFVPVRSAELFFANEVAVALGRDGAAVVALLQDPGHVVALHRAAGVRRFSAPQGLAGRPRPGVSFVEIDTLTGVGDRPQPVDETELRRTLGAAFDGAGRALLTWTRSPTRWRAAAALAAVSDATGRFADPAPVGSRCRAATAIRPLPLAGGGLGVAWTDLGRLRESGAAGLFGYTQVPSAGGGRLNVAVPRPEGAAPPAGLPAPRVSARIVGSRALRIGAPLRLRVRCPRGGSPCAVRAAVTAHVVERRDGKPRRFGGTEALGDATTLAPGEVAVLRLDPSPGMRIAALGRGRAQVALTACAPSGTAAAGRELRPRLRGLPRSPSPRLVDVRARRHGGAVRVTGRLSRPARGASVVVLGEPRESQASVELRGRTRFGTTLRGPGVGRTRSVTLLLNTEERWDADQMTVRVG